MSRRAELETIARRWLTEGWRQGNAAIIDELHAPDFVDHDPGGRSPDNAGFKEGIVRLYAAFPDFTARLEGLVVDEAAGTVAVRWSANGTQAGAYLGAAASGRRIDFTGIEILLFRGNLIAERWGQWDGIDLLVQLGRL